MDYETENIFIDCTAKDVTKASIVLNTLIAMFSEYCDDRFSAEIVDVVYEEGSVFPEGRSLTYPDFSEKHLDCSVAECCSTIGAAIPVDAMLADLHKMQLDATVLDADTIRVNIPITRSDVIHPCDVFGGLSGGGASCRGRGHRVRVQQHPAEAAADADDGRGAADQPAVRMAARLHDRSDMIRAQIAMAGYTEVLTLSLCSRAENYAMLRLEEDGLAVRLANPKTVEFEVCRTSLLPGILKTFRENKHVPYAKGVKLFEVSDVVLKDPANYVGARNERRVCAVYMGQAAQLEVGIGGRLGRRLSTD